MMTAIGRFLFFGLLLAVWVLIGLLIIAGYFSWCAVEKKQPVIRWWSQKLLRLCRVQLKVSGAPQASGAVLWVANHVSWLDIFVINSVRINNFVVKSDIEGWLVLGWVVVGAGSGFMIRACCTAV